MNRFRDQLLARTALALDQHGRPARRHLRHQVEQPQHRLALAHDVLKVVALLQRAFQVHQFLLRLRCRPIAARISARSFSLSHGF